MKKFIFFFLLGSLKYSLGDGFGLLYSSRINASVIVTLGDLVK